METIKNISIDDNFLEMMEDGLYVKEVKYQPTKQRMRVRWHNKQTPSMDWRDDRHPNMDHMIWKQVYGFIKKHIGQNYDKVFSEFCSRPEFKDRNISVYSTYFTPKDYFRQLINGRNFWRRLTETDFIIDSQNRIQMNPDIYIKPVKDKDIPVYLPKEEQYEEYTPKMDVIQKYKDIFINIFSQGDYEKVMKMIENDWVKYDDNSIIVKNEDAAWAFYEDTMRTLPEYKRMWFTNESFIDTVFRFFFDMRAHYIDRYIKYGTAEYYDYLSYMKRMKQQEKKKKENKSNYAEAVMIYRKRHPEIEVTPTYEQLLEEFKDGIIK